MKIIAIGDTHGKDYWQTVVKENSFDKIVFIGDYFDSWDVSGRDQIDNFMQIMEFKKQNFNKVIILIGNHDYQYMKGAPHGERYSGYQSMFAKEIQDVLDHAFLHKFLQLTFAYRAVMFSHAGVTETWAKSHNLNLNQIHLLSEEINFLFRENQHIARFTAGENMDNTGDDVTQSPIWVRPNSLEIDHVKGLTHVVGHTRFKEVTKKDNLIFLDCLDKKKEFLTLNFD